MSMFTAIAYYLISLLSILSNLVLPIVYIVKPSARQYPNSILVLICIAEIIQITTHDVLIWMTPWTFSFDFFQSILIFAIYLEQAIIIVWCFDILINLTVPFGRDNTGQSLSYLFIFLYSLGNTMFEFPLAKNVYNNGRGFGFLGYNSFFFIRGSITNLVLSLIQVFYFVILLFTFILLFNKFLNQRRIPRKSFIKKVQQDFVKFQLILIGITNLLQDTMFISTLVYAMTQSRYYELEVFTEAFPYYLLNTQGFLLTIPRLMDPYFRRSFMQIINGNHFDGQEQDQPMEITQWNVPLQNLIQKVNGVTVVTGILNGIVEVLDQGDNNKQDLVLTTSLGVEIKQINSLSESILSLDESLDEETFLDEKTQMQIISHGHQTFNSIRRLYNISDMDLKRSLDLVCNKFQIIKLSQSMGKSGAFFFTSYDQKFIVKTIKSAELDVIRSGFAVSLEKYMRQNLNTLICPIFGCFSVSIQNVDRVDIIILDNCFHKIGKATRVYDLKGSTYKRQKRQEEFIRKDLDLLSQEIPYFRFSPQQAQIILNQQEKDSDFLFLFDLMDYSILLAEKDGPPQQSKKFDNKMMCHEGIQRSMAIIDYLQVFNTKKRIEYMAKYCNGSISCVPPKKYRKRFQNFLQTIIRGE